MKITDININKFYLMNIVILSIGFTLLGTKSTQDLSLFASLIFWLIHISYAMLLYVASTFLVLRFLTRKLNRLILFFISSVIGGLLFSLTSIFIEIPFFDVEISFNTILEEIPQAFLQSFTFWILINIPFLMSTYNKNRETLLEEEKEISPLLTFLKNKKLPCPQTIKSEANYIRLYFQNESYLFLYSIKDASSDLKTGLQVHRSHWVNQNQIEGRFYIKKSPYLKLKNGNNIPIGRTFFKYVKENTPLLKN